MGVTINVNGLSLVHKKSSGVAIATIPDVCKTPSPGGPVPIPYPNFSFSNSLDNGSKKVKGEKDMIAVKGSEFSRSTGDEPGTVGGIKSGTNMKEAKWLTFSFDVKIERKNACRLSDKMTMNHGNTFCLAGENQLNKTVQELTEKLCKIFCETIRDQFDPKTGKWKIKPSEYAKRLGKGKYAQALGKFVSCEKSFIVKLGKLGGRSALSAQAIGRRVSKGLAQQGAKKVGGKIAAKILVKFVPGLNLVSLAYDAYELGAFALEVYKMATTVLVRPDIALLAADGTTVEKAFDYKFPGDSLSDDQREAYEKLSGNKKLKIIDGKECAEKCKAMGVSIPKG